MAKDTRAGSKVRGDKLPAILMASHLLEGDTVFLIKGGWTRDPRDARIAHDQALRDAHAQLHFTIDREVVVAL